MYCGQCGAEIKTSARFCHNCGAEVENQVREKNTDTEKAAKIRSSGSIGYFRSSTPSVVDEAITTNQGKTSVAGKHYPWRRFFARTVDIFTLGMLSFLLVSFLIGYFFPHNIDSFIKAMENPITLGIISYLFWLPIEAGFLSALATTPAKWVFGISILSKKGVKLSYASALQRAFQVWIQGEAFGIPLIILFTRIFAYKRLNRTGTTLWDTSVGSVVTHKKWGVLRASASVFIVLITLVVMAVLNLILKIIGGA